MPNTAGSRSRTMYRGGELQHVVARRWGGERVPLTASDARLFQVDGAEALEVHVLELHHGDPTSVGGVKEEGPLLRVALRPSPE